MDYIFLVLILIFSIRGFFKGFGSMVYDFLATILSSFFAIKFYLPLFNFLSLRCHLSQPISIVVSETINILLPGTFSNVQDIFQKTNEISLPMFRGLFQKLLQNISFEGELSAGQIFGQSITDLVLKTISIVLAITIFLIIFKIIKKIIKNILKKLKIKTKNQFFGTVLGFLEGLFIFSIINLILISLGNFLLNPQILQFAESGIFSEIFIDIFDKKIISIFL